MSDSPARCSLNISDHAPIKQKKKPKTKTQVQTVPSLDFL